MSLKMNNNLNPFQLLGSEPKSLKTPQKKSTTFATVFFFIFFLVVLGFGGWMICLATFDPNTKDHIKSTVFAFGILTLATSVVPLWFAVALIRAKRPFEAIIN